MSYPSRGSSHGNSSHRGRGRGLMFQRVQTTPHYDLPNPNAVRTPASPLLAEYDNPQHLAWVSMLEEAWNLWKKDVKFQERLYSYYESVPNPYMGALYVMLKAKDFRLGKIDSLAYTAIEDFGKWIQPRRQHYSACLTPDLMQFAFAEVCKQRNTSLIKMVCDIYECSTIKEKFSQDIEVMLKKKDYKEACLCATFLGLNSRFSVEDFLIPLLFQDKINIAETFLKDDPVHQKEVIAYLDRVIGAYSVRTEVDSIISRLDIPHCKMEKLYYKPLSKLITRFVKQFKMSMEEICPNLARKKKRGVLFFLINKRYIETPDQNQNLSTDSWREMVLEGVHGDAEMQLELVRELDIHQDYDEAVYWAQKFNMPVEQLPPNTQDVYKQKQSCDSSSSDADSNQQSTNQANKEVQGNADYHKLKIPVENIIMVSDAASFARVLETGFNDVTLVGLDSEWKPLFCSGPSTIALLQIATSTHVYIFDTFSLQPVNDFKDLWNQLGAKLFANQNIIKLGFGLSTDLKAIKGLLPLGDVKLFGLGYLDLSTLWQRLAKEFSIQFPFKDDDAGSGLSKLVALTLGKSLCKGDQFSNWENRPLRQAQIEYAALDAYCLIEVYKVLEKVCDEQNIPFATLCQEIMSNYVSKKMPKKKGALSKPKVLSMAPSPIKAPVSVHDLKFVVDTMICGLGYQLRKCGIDAVMLQKGDAHHKALEIATKEKRMVLTRGQVYEKLYGCLKPGHCYRVDADNIEDQLQEVLDYYKIDVKEEDIFSRCQLCNENEFSIFSSADVRRILTWTPQPVKQLHTYDDYPEDDFDSHLEYVGYSDEECSDDDFVPGPSHYTPTSFAPSEEGFNNDMKAEAQKIPPEILNKIDKFYCCKLCYKFYWDGSHLERTLNHFSRLKLSSDIS
nr:PREDICTED: exonuclease mut-7 homolog [Bemisia tabaci]